MIEVLVNALKTVVTVVVGALLLFIYLAGVFILRYFIGEKTFWGKQYLKQGYSILLSRRLDAYLMDTLVICLAGPVAFVALFDGKSFISDLGLIEICGLLSLVGLIICGRLLEKTCAFYHDQGLLLSKPFRPLRSVPWNEIGSIQKRPSAQIYNVLDQNGRRLAWFPLTQKTCPFFDVAQKNGVSVRISEGDKMVSNASGRRLNGTLGNWDTALAQSTYAKNNVICAVPFQDFIVLLFMDRRLNEDNIIAINRDGTIRWKIADIVKLPEPVSYADLARGNDSTISVMAVMSRQYDCIIFEIDVSEQKIVRQYPKGDCS